MRDGGRIHILNYTRLFAAFPNLDDGMRLNYRTKIGFVIEFNTDMCNYDKVRMLSVGMIVGAAVRFVCAGCVTAAVLDLY